jgi:hypothetical protein
LKVYSSSNCAEQKKNPATSNLPNMSNKMVGYISDQNSLFSGCTRVITIYTFIRVSLIVLTIITQGKEYFEYYT